MREFDKPIGRVWRRMRFQRFLAALVWSWAACLALTAVTVAVEKFAHRAIPGPDWVPFAVAGGVGLVVAALIALFTGPGKVEAAVAIDHAFGLNERLSTALTLPVELRETPAGRALLADTVRHIDKLDIGAKFGLHVPRRAWVPLVPAALAVGLLFVPDLIQAKARAGKSAEPQLKKDVAVKIAKTLGKQIAKQREKMDKGKFSETDKLLAEIEKAAEKLEKSPPAEKDKAMVELNKLTDALKERQKQLGGAEQVMKQLQQLKDMKSTGGAEDFAKHLAQADFKQAAEDVRKLAEKMANDKLTEAEKKIVQEQLAEMKQQLEKLANMEERKKQLQEALKNGGLTKEQYEQQMSKLEEQSKQLAQLQKLAQQLGKAGEGMKQGDMKKAAEALGMSQEQLKEMAQQASDLESLDQALADVQDAKTNMSGEGMNQLGENLEGANMFGDGMNMPGNGFGMGRGRGRGDRPEAADNVNYYNTKAKQQYGKGKAVLEGFAPPSKQTKGESIITEQEAIEASGAVAAEALSNQKVPKNVEKHVLNYFDQIRKGD